MYASEGWREYNWCVIGCRFTKDRSVHYKIGSEINMENQQMKESRIRRSDVMYKKSVDPHRYVPKLTIVEMS